MSSTDRVYDVVVIGGGPAGANAALFAASGGLRTALIERESLPRYKTCGGGACARAWRHLPADFVAPIEREFRDVEMRFLDRGQSFVVHRDAPIVSMTMRADLDHALVEAARRAGVDVLTPCSVTSIANGTENVLLETSSGRIRADFVVAADGATGACARLAGWTSTLATIPALEAEVRVSSAEFAHFAPRAVFDFGTIEHGYAWIFPKREHLSIGILTMKRGSAHLREALSGYLAACGVREVTSIEHHGFVIPVAPRTDGFARGRVLLAGDAAGFADPLTGEGISIAMHSGKLAAEAILEHPRDPRRVAAHYERRVGHEIVRDLKWARVLARILYGRPKLTQKLFDHAGQALCEGVADVVTGQRTYGDLIASPAHWLGAAKVLARATVMPR
jgi:geranylgeranyl reductase family protein